MDLTPNQRKALRFIHAEIIADGEFPSMRDIADHVGLKRPFSGEVLCYHLAEKGYLTRRGVGRYTLPQTEEAA